ncbi:branched-chain amino acid ABC transporter permease [Actinomadura welshii]|uniref:branched-chain amino acid ABC transporter permease n=1 Tax=Actinomadura welshii TaxID=3103817 RepID=UPI0003AD4C03|nr:branched-chain amino acid ABC transporter permease [Actinomadura madurae]
MNTYLPAVATIALLYGALGLSLNLQVGRTGVINFGHVAFFGVGAYATALLSLHGVSLALSIPAAGVLGGLAALPLGWIAARLTSHYLAIVTIAFAETLRVLLQNLEATGGPSGLVGVPRPFGQLDPDVFAAAWLALAAGLLAGTWLLVRVVTRGLLGMGLSAIKEDEPAAAMLGRSVAAYKTTVLVWGSVLAAVAGAFYAHWVGFVTAEQFDPRVTFYIWAGIIIGGARHAGACLGAAGIAAVFEFTRFVRDFGFTAFSDTQLASLRWIAIGVILIVMMRLRPEGLLPPRSSRHLKAGPPDEPDAAAEKPAAPAVKEASTSDA